MYHFIEDKLYLKTLKIVCFDIVNQLKLSINNDKKLKVEFHLVGSGARELVAQNEEEPVDLDFNLCITDFITFKAKQGREIKEYVRKKFNEVLNKKDWSDCEDSTAALTTEKREFKNINKTPFSIDLAIVRKDVHGYHRLIHNKTGNTHDDTYIWNQIPFSKDFDGKVKYTRNAWSHVCDTYLNKKNHYLKHNDYNHPSYVVYVEAVNEIYNTLANKQAKNPDKEAKKRTVQSPANISDKTKFSNSIQQTLAKSKIYDNKTIGVATKLACKNYSRKLTKEFVRKELLTELGKTKGTDIYNRIANKLK